MLPLVVAKGILTGHDHPDRRTMQTVLQYKAAFTRHQCTHAVSEQKTGFIRSMLLHIVHRILHIVSEVGAARRTAMIIKQQHPVHMGQLCFLQKAIVQ